MKVTKEQSKKHIAAAKLLEEDRPLRRYEVEQIHEDLLPQLLTNQTHARAFFTPHDLARDLTVECRTHVPGGTVRVLDLCAGIGRLGTLIKYMTEDTGTKLDLTCVEICPEFVAVGKRLLPEARWIEASVFSLDKYLDKNEKFDYFTSNPPFGAISDVDKKRFSGNRFEWAVAEIGMGYSEYGVMIVPSNAIDWAYSGRQDYAQVESPRGYDAWKKRTGLILGNNCGLDCSHAKFQNVKIKVEITVVDRSL